MAKDDDMSRTRDDLLRHEDECGRRYREIHDKLDSIQKDGTDFQLETVAALSKIKEKVANNTKWTWFIGIVIILGGAAKEFL